MQVRAAVGCVTAYLWFPLFFGLAACTSNVVKPDAGAVPQELVAKLAQARWDALIKGDLGRAYEFMSPGSRAVMPLEIYKTKTRTGMWKKVDVKSVSCELARCEVRVAVEYSYRDAGLIETYLDEVWLQDGGNWWFVPRR